MLFLGDGEPIIFSKYNLGFSGKARENLADFYCPQKTERKEEGIACWSKYHFQTNGSSVPNTFQGWCADRLNHPFLNSTKGSFVQPWTGNLHWEQITKRTMEENIACREKDSSLFNCENVTRMKECRWTNGPFTLSYYSINYLNYWSVLGQDRWRRRMASRNWIIRKA